MFENRRKDRQAINFITNVPKSLDLKSSSEQKLTLGALDCRAYTKLNLKNKEKG